MAESLPANVIIPDPRNVTLALHDMGWHVTVYADPHLGPMHNPTVRYRRSSLANAWQPVDPAAELTDADSALPDEVWLEALKRAGMWPVPCLGCVQAGEGGDCLAGRCRRASRLRLPPSATWRESL